MVFLKSSHTSFGVKMFCKRRLQHFLCVLDKCICKYKTFLEVHNIHCLVIALTPHDNFTAFANQKRKENKRKQIKKKKHDTK